VLTENDLTQLLSEWQGGDAAALERLTPLVYQELRKLARRTMVAERRDHTLQPTALVHEAYLRLAGGGSPTWESRAHFFGIAARIMRRLLVEHARGHSAEKRGGGALHLALDDVESFPLSSPTSPDRAAELVALDRALDELSALDGRKARALELRAFGGLTIQETAAALGVSTATVILDTRFAKAWLSRRVQGGGGA